MLNTFDALADFSDTEKEVETKSGENASVDLSSIINRLNDMENKLNQLVNAQTQFPTSGNENNDMNNISESEEENESNTSS